jgi:hypothetical protein
MSDLGASQIPNPLYTATRFRLLAPCQRWPPEFVIITAYAPTGRQRSDEKNEAADQLLASELEALGLWRVRITGYSPDTGHAEPGWAVELAIEAGREIGRRFQQDAIFVIRGDDLGYVHCDASDPVIWLGRFRERVDAQAS